ncbi:MAG: hypothetical protein KME40_30100 [Komarekiella atlantica HA4396-MV6]|jgi:hypothetical protein|nr:hypothetical protein [Komarekiella atlantica HA4396-MV6]
MRSPWRPTILVATPEHKVQGFMGLAVDNHKVEAVSKWLTLQSVEFSQVPPEDVIKETQKGLAVFNLVSSSIPPKTLEKMTKKFGAVIESSNEYQQKVSSLATRPQFLKPPDQPKLPEPKHWTQPTSTISKQSPVPLPITPTTSPISNSVKTEPKGVTNRPVVSIDDLRNWYAAADKLGKSEEYKQRIVEVSNGFKTDQQLSDKALTAMNQDKQEYRSISRLTQIAQRVGMVLGKPGQDGFTKVQGQVYNISFNTEQKDLAIAHQNREIVLDIQSGKVKTNQVSPQVLQFFEETNTKIDKVLAQAKNQGVEI